LPKHDRYTFALSNIEQPDPLTAEDPSRLRLLADSFHDAAITGLDVATCKPLVATSSLDCSVRVWNYQNNALELHKLVATMADGCLTAAAP